MIRGVGGATPKYIILLDTPGVDVSEKFFPLLKRAIKACDLKSEDFYVTYLIKEEGIIPSAKAAQKYKKDLEEEICSKRPPANMGEVKILFLGKVGADIYSEGRFKTLQRNSRRWLKGCMGTTYSQWHIENKRKYIDVFGAKVKISSLTDEEKLKAAKCDHHIVETPWIFEGMLGMSLAMYLSDPSLEEIFYEDLKYFTTFTGSDTGNASVKSDWPNIDISDNQTYNIISFDTETDSKILREVRQSRCVGFAFAGTSPDGLPGRIRGSYVDTTQRWAINNAGRTGGGKDTTAEKSSALEKFLGMPVLKAGYNIKYDLHVLRKCGVKVAPPYADVKTLLHLYAEHMPEKDLKTASRYLMPEFPQYDGQVVLEKTRGKAGTGYENIPIDVLKEYCRMDSIATLSLFDKLMSKLSEKQKSLFYLESSFLELIYSMECNGFFIDKKRLETIKQDTKTRITSLENSLRQYADINWNSPIAIKKTLPFLPDAKEETLMRYRENTPVIPFLIEYKKLSKLFGTYLNDWESFCETVDDEHMRLTYEFKQDGTRSGRLSATDPAIQTLPKDTKERPNGGLSREMFVSRFGESGRLLEIDASQLEYRFMAYASQDPVLLQAYREGSDMHSQTSQFFGIERAKAKTVNFLILFGGGEYRLADELKIPVPEAKVFIDRLFDRYKGVKNYIDATKQFVRSNGYVESMFGRVRRLGFGRDRRERGHLERAGLNTTIQGPAVDYVKASALAGWKMLKRIGLENNALPIITVHDSIVFDCQCEDDASMVFSLMKEAFENPNRWSKKLFGVEFNLPFAVEAKIGTNYRNLRPYKNEKSLS